MTIELAETWNTTGFESPSGVADFYTLVGRAVQAASDLNRFHRVGVNAERRLPFRFAVHAVPLVVAREAAEFEGAVGVFNSQCRRRAASIEACGAGRSVDRG